MQKATLKNIKEKMIQALTLIKEALDMSIPILKTNQKNNIIGLWEAFVREIIHYIKLRSKETGTNLLNSISFRRIWFK